jgi:hypothetical protein
MSRSPFYLCLVVASLALVLFASSSVPVADGTLSPNAATPTILTESSRLHLVKSHGLVLNERGQATGTFACRLTLHFRILSATRGIATLTAYPRGGSITGRARAEYVLEGNTGNFHGSMTITRGTGSFARVSGRNLSLEGTINPNTLGLTAKLTGQVRL